MRAHAQRPPDRGSATVWAAFGIAVIMTVFVVGLHLGAAVIARHRAEAAADLAALAAAGLAVEGAQAACRRAGEVAGAMGGTVTSCRLAGWDALLEVRVPISVALPGIDTATGRARAGPVPTAGESPPAPPGVGPRRRTNQPCLARPVPPPPAARRIPRRAVARRGQAGPADLPRAGPRRSRAA
ncbi:Rv3654c family TadE-like protein [Pseudonocardia adelaidensis]|uniref:Putative Flp pilus-assembly TadG-like N-terminal domain-containing protein n=1 Tax=Pseudonocardia adelaidensis TaxID=648754 RepID=A0ABP9NR90_9PSEU